VRNHLHDISVSPVDTSRRAETVPRLFQSPALLSDAVRRLGLAAGDRVFSTVDLRRVDDGENILRIMTNLLTFSEQKLRRDAESKPLGDISYSYSLLPSHSTVFISKTTDTAGADRKVASEYIFESNNLAAMCERNAFVANKYGRHDHQRIFNMLRSLFSSSPTRDNKKNRSPQTTSNNSFMHQLINGL
jgi:hypothetical protein